MTPHSTRSRHARKRAVHRIDQRDRDAARRTLRRLLPPTDVAMRAGNEARYTAFMFTLETLLALAKPIPPALRARLRPWLVEADRQRGEVLVEMRRADRNDTLPYQDRQTREASTPNPERLHGR